MEGERGCGGWVWGLEIPQKLDRMTNKEEILFLFFAFPFLIFK